MKRVSTIDRKLVVAALLILAAIICGFVGLRAYVICINGTQQYASMDEPSRQLKLTLTEEKRWPEEVHGYLYGVQYDIDMHNLSDTNIGSWEMHLQLAEGTQIDSSWNGVFLMKEDGILVTPAVYNGVIKADESSNVGFVLYTNEQQNLLECSVRYYRQVRLQDLPAAWVLILISCVYVAAILTSLLFMEKTRRLEAQKQQYMDIVNESFLTFANMIDAKDPYTQGHSQRVAVYAKELARRMGLSLEEQQHLFYVALLHDIGKIGVPDAILKKAGKLDADERNMIEQHVQIGGDILQDFSAIEGIEAGARYHHERFDGTGYVSSMTGKQIPLFARIICVADAFDAMTSMRCYRPSLPMDLVIRELTECAGTQFDPEIVPYMLQMIREGIVPVELNGSDLYAALSAGKVHHS